MAREQNGSIKLARIVVPIIVALVLALTLGISKWTVSKTVDLDKSLTSEIATNKVEHDTFEKNYDKMFKEQRSMNHKLDKMNDRLFAIATKIGADTP